MHQAAQYHQKYQLVLVNQKIQVIPLGQLVLVVLQDLMVLLVLVDPVVLADQSCQEILAVPKIRVDQEVQENLFSNQEVEYQYTVITKTTK